MNINAEIRATRGRVLGEGVWRFLAIRGGLDPKDPAHADQAEQVVSAVQALSMVMDETGFEGIEDFLKTEEEFR